MKNHISILILTAIAVFIFTINSASANQTIFNVPSADVLDAKNIYIENDWYLRSWGENTNTAQTYARGMVGIGKNIEIGAQTGPFDIINSYGSFLDFTIKWKPISIESKREYKSPGSFQIYMGNLAGIGLNGTVEGKGRNMVYGAAALRLPNLKTRLSAGTYFATKQEFGERRAGMLASFEQPFPLNENITIAADWYSGNGGYLTAGLMFNISHFPILLGYGFANTNRSDDLLNLGIGYKF